MTHRTFIVATVAALAVVAAVAQTQTKVRVTVHSSPNCATAPLLSYRFNDRTCNSLPERPGVSVFFTCDAPTDGDSAGGTVRACDNGCNVCSEATAFRNDQVRGLILRKHGILWQPGVTCGHPRLAPPSPSMCTQCVAGLVGLDSLTVKATCSQKATSGARSTMATGTVAALGVVTAVGVAMARA